MGFLSWLRTKAPSQPELPDDPLLREIKFGGGGATIRVPAQLKDATEEDGTIVVYIPGNTAVTLRLSLLTFAAKDGSITPAKGAGFVRKQAANSNAELLEIAGWPAYTEHKQSEENGTRIGVDFWYVGGDDAIAILSIAIDSDLRESAEAIWFLKQMPRILQTLQFAFRVEMIETATGTFEAHRTTIDPSPQEILDFGSAEQNWLKASLRNAEMFAARYDVPASSDKLTPEVLDRIFARWLGDDAIDRAEGDAIASALGAAMGEYLIRSDGMRWVVVKDQYGAAYAVRSEHGEAMGFPVESVRKRVESRETPFIVQIAALIQRQIEEAKEKP